MASAFKIDRKTASDLLNVSERTLDRYIRSGRLNVKKIGRKVLLSESEIQKLRAEMGVNSETVETVQVVEETPTTTQTKEVATTGTKVKGDIYMNVENVVYKDLFQKAAKELQQKDDDIKMLNYKLGKLETQIKNTVPLLDFRRNEDAIARLKNEHKEELTQKDQQLESAYKMYNTEKINKYIYLSILGGFAGITVITWIMQALMA